MILWYKRQTFFENIAVIYENAVDQISRRRIVCKGAISREKKRVVVKMSASARDAQMYFLVPGKYRENMPGSEESVIVTEQRSPLLVVNPIAQV